MPGPTRKPQSEIERPSERTQEAPEEVTTNVPEKKSTKVTELTYGDEITVETTGDFSLYDAETATTYDSNKSTSTKHTRFTENMLEQGKLRLK